MQEQLTTEVKQNRHYCGKLRWSYWTFGKGNSICITCLWLCLW